MNELDEYVELAKAVIAGAENDLNKDAKKRHRKSAYEFFTDPASYLTHWCAVLSIAPEAIRFQVREKLNRYELDNRQGGVIMAR